ncbi:MAG: peptidase M61 [Rhodoferax sp.]|nr:peptidase M61 [Rhodoferax sp.]MCF8208792.1 peptidase M61 [Rhodoferax sp.]
MPCAIHYRVEIADLHAHLFGVTLYIAQPKSRQIVSLPVWIPGSYLVREFSKNLQGLSAWQNDIRLPIRQLSKNTWEIDNKVEQALIVCYQVYAFDRSVRTAWLDATRGFFNGTSLFLQVDGQQEHAHSMELVTCEQTPDWLVATGADPIQTDLAGWGSYRAENYDALVDCPVEMGPFWHNSFEVRGIRHRFVVSGVPPAFDGDRLLSDTRAICEAEIRFWHGEAQPVHQAYVFMLNAVDNGYGGLEHRNSTALICPRRDLPRQSTLLPEAEPARPNEGYTRLLGLISHEYFHTWNVKRLRPKEFRRYNYGEENYTNLLWFFEGFTSYYDDLLLLRAQRIDNETYLKLLAKTINLVNQTPGRKLQSVAEASFDAWIKYYRQDENSPNATVSYYSKGSLVALCLDLTLRAEGHTSLDAVMVALWSRTQGGPMSEQDVLETLHSQGRRSFDDDFSRWIHSTSDLPVTELLQLHGIEVQQEIAPLADQLGLRTKDTGGVHIQQVMRGSTAEQAGFASGDEWIAVEPLNDLRLGTWRMQTLDDLALFAGPATQVAALVARDKRILKLNLVLPQPSHSVRLVVSDAAKARIWLDGTN